MKKLAAILFAALLAAPAAFADDKHHQAANEPTIGEVRKVDREAKKITIKHGPLSNLDMPAMTMVFRVKDPAMLEQVKAGDKVKFVAEKVGGTLTVTKIEQAK